MFKQIRARPSRGVSMAAAVIAGLLSGCGTQKVATAPTAVYLSASEFAAGMAQLKNVDVATLRNANAGFRLKEVMLPGEQLQEIYIGDQLFENLPRFYDLIGSYYLLLDENFDSALAYYDDIGIDFEQARHDAGTLTPDDLHTSYVSSMQFLEGFDADVPTEAGAYLTELPQQQATPSDCADVINKDYECQKRVGGTAAFTSAAVAFPGMFSFIPGLKTPSELAASVASLGGAIANGIAGACTTEVANLKAVCDDVSKTNGQVAAYWTKAQAASQLAFENWSANNAEFRKCYNPAMATWSCPTPQWKEQVITVSAPIGDKQVTTTASYFGGQTCWGEERQYLEDGTTNITNARPANGGASSTSADLCFHPADGRSR